MPRANGGAGAAHAMTSQLRRRARHRLARDLTPDRRAVLDHLPKGAVGAEVGVWRGDFTDHMFRRCRPRTLHLIDPWAFQADLPRSLYGGLDARGQDDMDAVHGSVVARFRRPIAAGRVVVHRAASVDALAGLGEHSLDWVYIDGDHRYGAVLADLEAGGRTVRPGGLLALDDYGTPGWWEDGVTRAVDEFVAAGSARRVHRFGDQVLLQVPGA